METTMYDTLLQLPLLQGLGKNDLTNILAKVKFHFRKYGPGQTIVKQGTPCRELYFLINGDVQATFADDRYDFSIQETFSNPLVIEPYSLFGMHTEYTATYEAHTAVDVICIDKSYVVDELNNYEIFRFNFLNIISNRAQVAYAKLWNCRVGDIREKIVNFVALRVKRNEGEKRLRIKMEDLAMLIDESRLNVSKELNAMQQEGLVRLGRKEVLIPDLQKLI
jgi:CRP-like cAMP-binding protein